MTMTLERALEVLERRSTGYTSQSARDAQERSYGKRSYWDYLERAAIETRDYYLRQHDADSAEEMMTRSLSEALRGNDGD